MEASRWHSRYSRARTILLVSSMHIRLQRRILRLIYLSIWVTMWDWLLLIFDIGFNTLRHRFTSTRMVSVRRWPLKHYCNIDVSFRWQRVFGFLVNPSFTSEKLVGRLLGGFFLTGSWQPSPTTGQEWHYTVRTRVFYFHIKTTLGLLFGVWYCQSEVQPSS